MRLILAILGGLYSLFSSYVATAHCCDRVNIFALVGLTEPGCMGLSQYRGSFMASSLLSVAFTVGVTLYGPGARPNFGLVRTTLLTSLSIITCLLLFVIP